MGQIGFQLSPAYTPTRPPPTGLSSRFPHKSGPLGHIGVTSPDTRHPLALSHNALATKELHERVRTFECLLECLASACDVRADHHLPGCDGRPARLYDRS
jgi:hypothetical protein